MTNNYVGTIATVLVIAIILLLSIQINAALEGAEGESPIEDRVSSPLVKVGQASSFEDTGIFDGEVNSIARVNDSTGESALLTGAPDSSFTSSDDIDFATDTTWTVSLHAAWNNTYGTTNGTAVSLDGRVIVQYDNSTGNWSAFIYNESSRDSYLLNVSATEQPGSLQVIQVVSNETHVAIYRNNTVGDTVAYSTEGVASMNTDASNWAGRVDEIRGYDDALSSSQRQQLIDDPVLPLNNVNRTFRVMTDEVNAGTEPVYFAPGTITYTNTTPGVGVPGTVLQAGTDYRVDLEAGSITALAGGRLDTAPTAFVHYEYAVADAVTDLNERISGVYGFAAIVPLALVASMLFLVVQRFKD